MARHDGPRVASATLIESEACKHMSRPSLDFGTVVSTRRPNVILVRDVFQLKFGKAREAKALWAEGKEIAKRVGYGAPDRVLTDLTGPYYTFVLESEHQNLAAYEESLGSTLGAEDWGQWYQKFVPLVESGRREVFTILE